MFSCLQLKKLINILPMVERETIVLFVVDDYLRLYNKYIN